jgi:hypothetical protein
MMKSIDFLFHVSKFTGNEDMMGIQQEINSERSKTLLGDMKDGMVMILFNYCSRDSTCLLGLIVDWI